MNQSDQSNQPNLPLDLALDRQEAAPFLFEYNPDEVLDSSLFGQRPLHEILAILEDLPVRWVQTQADLKILIETLKQCEKLAIDTEFIKRKTYYPKLALIQINTGQAIYLVDAPKLNLKPFYEALWQCGVSVWHACGEDLGILYQFSYKPPITNVFDTQIALTYLTGEIQVGYQRMISELLDIHLDKQEVTSDWLQRPLTKEQANYAMDDVRYLPCIQLLLEKKLREKGVYELFWEECQNYAKELYESLWSGEEWLYLDCANSHNTSEELAIMQAIALWREQQAKKQDVTRNFILKNHVIRAIAEKQPTTPQQLASIDGISPKVVRKYEKFILALIKKAKALPKDQQPKRVPPRFFVGNQTDFTAKIKQAVQNHAKKIAVPEEILWRKKWQQALWEVVYQTDNPNDITNNLPTGLQGSRKDWVMTQIVPIMIQAKQEYATYLKISQIHAMQEQKIRDFFAQMGVDIDKNKAEFKKLKFKCEVESEPKRLALQTLLKELDFDRQKLDLQKLANLEEILDQLEAKLNQIKS